MNFVHLLRLAQLHGIYRLSEKKDRFIWLIALLALFGTAVTSALVTLWRYESKPTYITRRENYRYNMTFPAVLICPELDFPDHKMEQFLENIRLPPNLNRTYIKSVLRQLATYYSPDVRYTVKDLENLAHLLRYNGMSLKPTFLRLTSTCEEMLLRCRWHGIIWNCTKLFQMEIMQFGTCCVFNGRSLKRDIVVQGLPLKRPSLKQYVNSIGYKSENGTALSPGLEMWFGYKIDPFEVSENSKSLSIGLRRCYLPNDEHLKYFPVYKQLRFSKISISQERDYSSPALLRPHCRGSGLPYGWLRRMGHDPPRWPNARVLTTANAAGTNGLTCLPKHEVARDNNFLVTHPVTDHCESCLTTTIAGRGAYRLRQRATQLLEYS
ncbi:unnamed protein product [Diatraea saccharalis]|uniref:Sodium channel protein Nach n=1 Tax=Diatraea saccharalis TaxID=40085 RepID=A0A9N9WEK8_9NEOP|nr:unnamed protein product [Diatraea saccharalis]